MRLVKQQLANLTKSQTSAEAAPEDKQGKKLKSSTKIQKRKKGNVSKKKKVKKTAVSEVELTDEQVIKRNLAYYKRTATSNKSSALMVQVQFFVHSVYKESQGNAVHMP